MKLRNLMVLGSLTLGLTLLASSAFGFERKLLISTLVGTHRTTNEPFILYQLSLEEVRDPAQPSLLPRLEITLEPRLSEDSRVSLETSILDVTSSGARDQIPEQRIHYEAQLNKDKSKGDVASVYMIHHRRHGGRVPKRNMLTGSITYSDGRTIIFGNIQRDPTN